MQLLLQEQEAPKRKSDGFSRQETLHHTLHCEERNENIIVDDDENEEYDCGGKNAALLLLYLFLVKEKGKDECSPNIHTPLSECSWKKSIDILWHFQLHTYLCLA